MKRTYDVIYFYIHVPIKKEPSFLKVEFILEESSQSTRGPVQEGGSLGRCLLERGATIVLGLSSIGNVGQLCIDIVLSTLYQSGESSSFTPKRVGHLRSPHLQPIIGFESFDGGKTSVMCKPLEVYKLQHPTKIVYAIIQRSLCKKNGSGPLAKDLSEFFTASSLSHVIVVTGTSTEFVDINRSARNANYFQMSRGGSAATPIGGGEFPAFDRWISNLPALNEKVVLATLKSTSGESVEDSSRRGGLYVITTDVETNDAICMSEDDQGKAPIGMLLSKLLLYEMAAIPNSPIRFTIVGKFVNEGLNVIDGRDLADSLLKAIADNYGASAPSSTQSLLVDNFVGGGNDIFVAIREKEVRMRRSIRYPSSWQRLLEQQPGLLPI